ncbi:hypothetical protein C8Q80DRAFT_1186368 [Daedaleopsis nitida]|nr:hypothetical protein C8Q80DRAFT_1186368 [Daedaleopsis nitida]
MNMNVNFTSGDTDNSTILDSSTGQLLFDVTTPRKLGFPKTTIRDGQQNIIAVCEGGWGQTKVTFHGETKKVNEWFPKKHVLSTSRMIPAPNGKTYVWKQKWSSDGFRLVDKDSKSLVAEAHVSCKLLSRHGDLSIDISSEVMPFLDAVILSFIISNEEKKLRELASSGVA